MTSLQGEKLTVSPVSVFNTRQVPTGVFWASSRSPTSITFQWNRGAQAWHRGGEGGRERREERKRKRGRRRRNVI